MKLYPHLVRSGGTGSNLSLPCGSCIGCRTGRATEWARRCSHEASSWEHNCFITLTYSEDHLPRHGHLEPQAFTRFIKRLRKYVSSSGSSVNRDGRFGVRYFACGEYGELSDRPHYHALLFNCGFSDLVSVGKDLFESAVLSELWPYGTNAIGKATGASASYIAQYSYKKVGQGDRARDGSKRPEHFLRMSLKPAIGSSYVSRFKSDLSHGFLVTPDGRRSRIPRAYLNRLKSSDGAFYEAIDYRAFLHRFSSSIFSDASSPDRLRDAEIIHHRLKELTESRSL